MKTLKFVTVGLLLLLLAICSHQTREMEDWCFHCDDEHCNDDGFCTGRCYEGYFGPGCRYADLVALSSINKEPMWLYDSDDSTCNPDKSVTNVTIKFFHDFPIAWVRLFINETDSLETSEVNITFDPKSGIGTFPCANPIKYTSTNQTLDIQCDMQDTVQEVVLEGSGVKSLCSVYISLSCLDGYYGVSCRNVCSANCLEKICHRENGDCLKCKEGKTGPQCDEDCPSGCKEGCHHKKRDCIHGCKANFHGRFCNKSCNPNCLNCDQDFGHCHKCVQGKHGRHCNRKCPASCGQNKHCDQWHARCTEDCPVGFHGFRCHLKCNISCGGDGSCEAETGHCSQGCHDGYVGNKCQYSTVIMLSGSHFGFGISVGIGLSVLTIGIGVFVYRRQMKARKARLERLVTYTSDSSLAHVEQRTNTNIMQDVDLGEINEVQP